MDVIILIENIIKSFIEENKLKLFENKLKVIKNKHLINLKSYIKLSSIIGTIFLLSSIIISFYLFNKNIQIILITSLFAFITPFFILYIIKKFTKT